ncbi:hypothetical protein ACWEKT_06870 [Nocardia takedensis]
MRRARWLIVVLLGAATACGAEETPVPPEAPPGPPPVPSVVLTIDGADYSRLPPITPGAVITVVNNDLVRHSVTSGRPGLFDEQIEPGASLTFLAPEEIGSHPFHCRYHAFMEGWLSIRS